MIVPLTDARGRLDGRTIVRLMAQHGRTIRDLSASMGLSMVRVRQVREQGTRNHHDSRDWIQGITGTDPGDLDPGLYRWQDRTAPAWMDRPA
jgi:hypothetical protein